MNIYTPKSADEIRMQYINKLKKMGIMKDQPRKKFQHRNNFLKNSIHI